MNAPATALAALLAVACVCAATGAPDAHAAFPGRNGRIAYTVPKTVCGSAADEDDSCETVSEIWTIRADGSGRTRLGGYASNPAFAPGGGRLAAEASRGTILVNAWTGKAQWGLSGAYQAAWSPDGQWLIFVAEGPRQSSVLLRAHPDGSASREVTPWPSGRPCPEGCPIAVASAPAWSTRGEIAFARVDPGHADVQGIATIRPDGHGLRSLTTGPADGDPDWAPDGRRLVFVRRSGNARGDLWTMTRGGNHLLRLTRGGADDTVPIWSPDGRFIAFSRNEHLWLMDADGRHPHPIPGARAGRPLYLDWEALR